MADKDSDRKRGRLASLDAGRPLLTLSRADLKSAKANCVPS